MEDEERNPIMARASRNARATAQRMAERDSKLERMIGLPVPGFPDIREDDPDAWYEVEIPKKTLRSQLYSYVSGVADAVWKGQDTKSYALTGDTQHVPTDFYYDTLQAVFENFVADTTPSKGLAQIFFLTLGKMLRGSLAEKAAEVRKRGSESADSLNYKVYKASRELQIRHNKFIRDNIYELNEIDPELVRRAFGPNGQTDFDDAIASVLFGKINATKPSRNGESGNPWAFFDFKPTDFRAEDFETVLRERYKTTVREGGKEYSIILAPSHIKEINRVLGDQIKKENPNLKDPVKVDEILGFLFDEKYTAALLSMSRPWPLYELMKQAVERRGPLSGLFKEAAEEPKRLFILSKLLEAYRSFIHDMHVYRELSDLERKVDISEVEFRDSTGPLNPNSIAFAPEVPALPSDTQEVTVTIDTKGYTRIATDKKINLKAKELHQRQSKIILGQLQRTAAKYGLKLVNKVGDEIIVSGPNVQDALYFAYHAKVGLQADIGTKLSNQYQRNIDRINRKLANLNKRRNDQTVLYDEGLLKSVERMISRTEGRLALEEERKGLLEEHKLIFRTSVAGGSIHHDEDEFGKADVSGDAVIKGNRLNGHVKNVTDAKYDARVINGAIDNQSGNVIEGNLVDDLERIVRGTTRLIQRFDGVPMLEEGPSDFIIHKEEDGIEIMYQSLTPGEIHISPEFSTRVWKQVTDLDEFKARYIALQTHKVASQQEPKIAVAKPVLQVPSPSILTFPTSPTAPKYDAKPPAAVEEPKPSPPRVEPQEITLEGGTKIITGGALYDNMFPNDEGKK